MYFILIVKNGKSPSLMSVFRRVGGGDGPRFCKGNDVSFWGIRNSSKRDKELGVSGTVWG